MLSLLCRGFMRIHDNAPHWCIQWGVYGIGSLLLRVVLVRHGVPCFSHTFQHPSTPRRSLAIAFRPLQHSPHVEPNVVAVIAGDDYAG